MLWSLVWFSFFSFLVIPSSPSTPPYFLYNWLVPKSLGICVFTFKIWAFVFTDFQNTVIQYLKYLSNLFFNYLLLYLQCNWTQVLALALVSYLFWMVISVWAHESYMSHLGCGLYQTWPIYVSVTTYRWAILPVHISVLNLPHMRGKCC